MRRLQSSFGGRLHGGAGRGDVSDCLLSGHALRGDYSKQSDTFNLESRSHRQYARPRSSIIARGLTFLLPSLAADLVAILNKEELWPFVRSVGRSWPTVQLAQNVQVEAYQWLK